MIPFFFTIPMRRMMPMMATMSISMTDKHQGKQRSDAGGGQCRENRYRMNVAFVQDAQNDVHRHQGSKNQEPHLSATRERRGRALVVGQNAWREFRFLDHFVNRIDRRAERIVICQVERYRHGRKLTLAVDR